MEEKASVDLRFDGDNSYPDCEACGKCCQYMDWMAITAEEYQRMIDYVKYRGITPVDYERKCCPLRSHEGLCQIWEARPQLCRLHHCKVSRFKILEANPSIQVSEDLYMVDLYQLFLPEKYAQDQNSPQ